MRKLSSEDVYQYYFKDRFKDVNTMVISFNVAKWNDKQGKLLNKTYILQSEYNYYNYDDILSVLKYQEQVNNTIVYAQQLIIDLESLIEQSGVKFKLGKLAKVVGIPQSTLPYLNLSYETALKVIGNIENKIKSLSLEAIQDLKANYNNLIKDNS